MAAASLQYSSESHWEEDYETSKQPPETIPFVKVTTTTSSSRSFESPAFSPDGSQLAVAEVIGKYAYTLICAVAEAGGEQCIPEGEPGAYVDSELACVICTARIVAISSTTGERLADLTAPPPGIHDFEPAYAVDGKMAYRREGDFGISSLFVVDSPGALARQVTDSGSAPDFSPDGSKLAFASGDGIGIVGTDGGSATTIPVPDPPGGEGYASSPAFSPDGTKIAFGFSVSPQGTPGEGLYTIGLDGSGMALVSSAGYLPSWQPLAPAPPPPPPPPKTAKAKKRKGKVRLSGRGEAAIGTIVCGSSPCTFSTPPARLKTGERKCTAAMRLPKRLGPGKSAPLKVKVGGKCLAALKVTGRGKLTARVRAADALGRQLLTIKSTLVSSRIAAGRSRG